MNTEALLERARAQGQEHLVHHAAHLPIPRRTEFLGQVAQLNFAELTQLFALSKAKDLLLDLRSIETPPVIQMADTESHDRALKTGEQALRDGRVAMIMVAGGQGTRLGHDAPKGTYPIGPVTQRSLFQIHAEKVLALSRRYGKPIPLLIMTSQENDQQTRDFFQQHHHFGLQASQVWYFVQGMLPALDIASGKVLLKAPGELALSPNGHGGVIQALHEAGFLDRMESDGITECFYFQVDNPLVKIGDPVFIGHHLEADAEMSLKVIPKLYATERMGNLVLHEGKYRIIEYTELPQDIAEQRMPQGKLRIWAGSPAIHLFQLKFLQRLGRGELSLPYHVARKAVSFLNEQDEVVKADSPNALKFERFVFDALPLASCVVAVEASREEEFEPLKNASGENSPESVRKALSTLYAQWLRADGVEIKLDANGQSLAMIEISPLVAMQAEDLKGKSGNPGVWAMK